MKTVKYLGLSVLAMGLVFTSCKKEEEEEEKKDETTVPVSVACGMEIGSADGPQVGDIFISPSADYSMVNVDSLILIEGDDKSWDFSDLTATAEIDSLLFLTPTGTPDGVAANLMIESKDGEKLFINSNANGLDFTSFDFGEEDEDVETSVSNPISFMPFTLTRGAEFIDEFELQAIIVDTIDTIIEPFGTQEIPLEIVVKQSNSNSFSVDACGKIITPKGEFDCLRYKVTPGEAVFSGEASGVILGSPVTLPVDNQVVEDNGGEEFNIFEGVTYVWIDKDHGFPILEVRLDENNDISSVSYLK